MPPLLPSARRKHQRHDAEDECERRHQNRPQPDARRFDRGVHDRQPLLPQLLGELDDQDRVLRREANQHHQTDLAVQVVLQTAHPLRRQRAEHGERHAQQHDERQHERFVLRRQRQVDEQNADAEDRRRLTAGLDLLERDARPGVAEPLRQRRRGQPLHLRERLPGARARRRRPVDLGRSEQVEMADHLRRRRLAHAHDAGERHHAAAVRPRVVLSERLSDPIGYALSACTYTRYARLLKSKSFT